MKTVESDCALRRRKSSMTVVKARAQVQNFMRRAKAMRWSGAWPVSTRRWCQAPGGTQPLRCKG